MRQMIGRQGVRVGYSSVRRPFRGRNAVPASDETLLPLASSSPQTGSLVSAMRTLILCIVAVLIVVEDVTAQHFNYFPRQFQRNRWNYGSFAAGSDVFRTYVPSQSKRDVEEAAREAAKVRLDVFYETDCPDSMRFITRQLYPLYQEMEEVLDIHLVPYGKAMERYNNNSGKYDFYCQHGASECYGNTVQACVMSLYPKKKEYINFINCMEGYPRPSRNGHKCARRLSLDWDKIEKCATGDEGNRLLHENAQLTENLEPRLYFVPWVVVDKVHTRTNQRTAMWNLKSVVCNAYKGTHPKCEETGDRDTTVIRS